MQSEESFCTLLAKCAFRDWRFILGYDDHRPYLQVEAVTQDNTDGSVTYRWRGRKWMLSVHATDSEVVQTALKAVLTAVEHEARETFQFNGRAIFCPHFDIHKLWALAAAGDALDLRDEVVQVGEAI